MINGKQISALRAYDIALVIGLAVLIGIAIALTRFIPAEVSTASPTTLILTIVDDENVPQVCIFDVATETIRDDNLHVVVRKTKCPALQ